AEHSWPCVAAKYLELIEHVLSPGVMQTPQAVSA
ncbi:MAG: hypothetical protein RL391_1699, partial [Actinomycetota bacterium]